MSIFPQAERPRVPLVGEPPFIEEVELDDAGDPEPSILEVQNALAAADRGDSAPIAEAPKRRGRPPKADKPVIPTATTIEPHPLDLAPVNSKIVMTKEGAVLATPDGPQYLPRHDVANRLPEDAKIQKVLKDGQIRYVARQLNAVVVYPDFVTTTAGEAIKGFNDHFHPTGVTQPFGRRGQV